MQDFEVIEIDGRKIVIRGIGKSFYQDGFPIAMAVSMFLEKGFSVSLFHLADELLKNGWSPDRVMKTLSAELADTIQGDQKIYFDPMSLSVFCHADYEAQRLMIFDDLFGDVQKAKHWLLSKTEN